MLNGWEDILFVTPWPPSGAFSRSGHLGEGLASLGPVLDLLFDFLLELLLDSLLDRLGTLL